MKKKILAAALAVALIAIVVGSSLAYFTDEDQVTNTFTFGSVLIDIYENGTITDQDVIPFNTALMIPVVDPTNPDDLGYFEKEVKVQSNGENPAYIRTLLAIPTKMVDYLVLDLNVNDASNATTGWRKSGEYKVVAEDQVEYTVYTYDYLQPVDPKAANEADRFTTDVLKGVYLASDVDLEEDAYGSLWFVKKNGGEIIHQSNFLAHTKTANGYESNVLSVLVAAQAIQAQGFDNATNALNTGFPIGTNPWG